MNYKKLVFNKQQPFQCICFIAFGPNSQKTSDTSDNFPYHIKNK